MARGLAALLAELKRRKVTRVAVAYAAAAFVVLQAADIAFPALGFPPLAMTMLVIGAIVGFPLALALAWVFEVRREAVPGSGAGGAALSKPFSKPIALGMSVGLVALVTITFAISLQGGRFLGGEGGAGGGRGSELSGSLSALLGSEWRYTRLTRSGAVDEVAISPDGATVAWVNWDPERVEFSGLFLQAVDGGDPIQLVEGGVVQEPSFSPDGDRIFFRSTLDRGPDRDSGIRAISLPEHVETWVGPSFVGYAVSPDGSRVLTSHTVYPRGDSIPAPELGAIILGRTLGSSDQPDTVADLRGSIFSVWGMRWSPDGSRILVHVQDMVWRDSLHWETGDEWSDLLFDPETKSLEEIPEGLEGWGHEWLPDGSGLAFLGPEGLKIARLASDNPAQAVPFFSGIPMADFAFSSDGTRIAYVRRSDQAASIIRAFTTDGPIDQLQGNPLTPSVSPSYGPSPSPDSEVLAFVMAGEIHTMPLGGGSTSQLTSLDAEIANLAWARNGSSISFVACDESDSCFAASVPSNGGPVRTGPRVPRDGFLPHGARVVPSYTGDSLFIGWPVRPGLLVWHGDKVDTLFPGRAVQPHLISPTGEELLISDNRALSLLSLSDETTSTLFSADDYSDDRSFFLGDALAWSSDGWIYFEREYNPQIGGVFVGGQEIWRIPVSGGTPEPAIRRSDGSPFWDSNGIVLSANGDMGFWTEAEMPGSDVYIADMVPPGGG